MNQFLMINLSLSTHTYPDSVSLENLIHLSNKDNSYLARLFQRLEMMYLLSPEDVRHSMHDHHCFL